MKKEPFKFEIGGMWEETNWEIIFDEKVQYNSNPCKHCGPIIKEIHNRLIDDSTYENSYFICPRVIVSVNEGGSDSTGICADCVYEALTQFIYVDQGNQPGKE